MTTLPAPEPDEPEVVVKASVIFLVGVLVGYVVGVILGAFVS